MAKKIIPLFIIVALTLLLSNLSFNKLQNAPLTPASPTPSNKESTPDTIVSTTSAVLGTQDLQRLEKATVERVVDGDTIKLTNGNTLRYIGINTPETVDPRRPVQCFGHEASDFNKQLVTGKTVYLQKDVSETDQFGRLLRYVYLENGQMVNALLVTNGYAYASAYPPDIKFQELFKKLEATARESGVGLWSSCNLPTTKQKPIATTYPQQPTTYSCDCSKTCNQISTCEEATFQLKNCSCKLLDGNNDGIACNSLCR